MMITQKEVENILKYLEIFFDGKEPELNSNKSTIIMFRKHAEMDLEVQRKRKSGKRRVQKSDNSNGSNSLRRIGERKFADDFCARMLMFNEMIKIILIYGAGI